MGRIVTSYGINKMTGRVGDAVFSIEEGGTGIRQYNGISKQPFSEAQLAREAAFTKANQTWPMIGLPLATAWRKYGSKQKVKTVAGKFRSREGKDCFTGYFAKMLQVNPQAAIPRPPVGVFTGDGVGVSVTMEEGMSLWTATTGNLPGVTTEFLAQEIPSAVALPSEKGYRTLDFFRFTMTDLLHETALAPGYWSLAYQFIEIATERTSNFKVLGTSVVGLALVQGGVEEAPAVAPARAKKAA